MARSLRDVTTQDTMVNGLLRVMGNATHVAGAPEHDRNVRQRLLDQTAVVPGQKEFATKVADARFMLGSDDGAYLRSNVMPLQTAEAACDSRLLSTPQPEMLRAGQLGVLNAVAEHIKKQRTTAAQNLADSFRLCGWLLSVEEVAVFVNAYLEALANANALTGELTTARGLAKAFLSKAVDQTQLANDLTKPANEDGVCAILKILLALFDLPMTTVEAQWEETLGANGTGTAQLEEGLNRLSLSARLVKSTFVTDQIVQVPLVIRLQRVRATGLSGMVGPIDFGATEFPVGWEEPADADDSLIAGAHRMQALMRKLVELQAYASLGKTPEQMRGEAEDARSQARAKEQTLAALRALTTLTTVQLRDARKIEADIALLYAKADVAEFEAVFRGLLEEKDKLLRDNEGRPPNDDEDNFERYTDIGRLLGKLPEENRNPDVEALEGVPDSEGPATTQVLAARERFNDALNSFERVQQTLEDEAAAERARNEQEQLQREEAEQIAREQAAEQARQERERAELAARQLEERIARERADREAAEAAAAQAEADRLALEAQNEADRQEGIRRAKEEVLQQSPTYCKDPDPSAIADGSTIAMDGLCAGVSQMRENGGASYLADGSLVRAPGVSPYFPRHDRQPAGHDPAAPDYWRQRLWPGGEPGSDSVVDLQARSRGLQPTLVQTPKTNAVSYAVVRGLCAKRAPHHVVPPNATTLKYTVPRATFPGNLVAGATDVAADTDEKSFTRSMFANASIPARKDFVQRPFGGQPLREVAKPVVWAPLSAEPTVLDGTVTAFGANFDGANAKRDAAVASAVVYECMVDDYNADFKTQPEPNGPRALLALACAAAAKIKQLESMATVFAQDDLTALCPATPSLLGNGKHHFMTRPVLRCPGRKSKVLYPCDAGLAAYNDLDISAVPAPPPVEFGLEFGQAYGRPNGTGGREVANRDDMTFALRSTLATNPPSENNPTEVPLYIAPPPGIRDGGVKLFDKLPEPRALTAPDSILPVDAPGNVAADKLASALRLGIKQCATLGQLELEEQAMARARDDLPSGADDSDQAARLRRDAVWNDAMREACIMGDRLYAFVRQFSGTISEQVDAVCMIDEGMLVRQQQEARQREARLSDRAAQEHMQLVRNVFSAVIRESGLTLGIGNTGSDIGQLKVVSNTLRKQASELSGGTSSGEGFFANSVRLENLLSKGTGEMTLEQLFAELKDAGRALQEAADGSYGPGDATAASTTLDFLSAPRNSLLLRYKPEALAAMRQAFDVFQREMLTQHGRMYRTITAYELVEGSDETLCSAFATFAAHMLVHSRMYSSSTAMYVAAWPAAANAQQLKISLQRLVRVACQYLAYAAAPNFLADNGREGYFGQQAAVGLPVAPPRYLYPHGQWSRNLYGDR